jgi:hypothetical protein
VTTDTVRSSRGGVQSIAAIVPAGAVTDAWQRDQRGRRLVLFP